MTATDGAPLGARVVSVLRKVGVAAVTIAAAAVILGTVVIPALAAGIGVHTAILDAGAWTHAGMSTRSGWPFGTSHFYPIADFPAVAATLATAGAAIVGWKRVFRWADKGKTTAAPATETAGVE